MLEKKVTNITTPGAVVDAIVTNEGIAINPRRKDLIEKIEGKIAIVPIEKLKDMAYAETGVPQELEFTDEIVGIIKWFDGTLLDVVRKVKE